MLNEGWPAEPEVEIGEDGEEYEKYDRMFPDKFYLKMFKMMDRNPEFFMTDILRNLGFEEHEEYDILYNYFVNYSDRKDYYVDFTIDPDDIASFFHDRDYGLEKIVKGLLEGDWDYHEWYNESFQFDDYMLSSLDDKSWGDIVGSIEVGDVFEKNSEGMQLLDDALQEGYPTLESVVLDVLYQELNDWGYNDEYAFVGDEKPYINTDKHFRYGGAGTMNDEYFNDMFRDRLSWDYSD